MPLYKSCDLKLKKSNVFYTMHKYQSNNSWNYKIEKYKKGGD